MDLGPGSLATPCAVLSAAQVADGHPPNPRIVSRGVTTAAYWLNDIAAWLELAGAVWLGVGARKTYRRHAGRVARGQAIDKEATRRIAAGERVEEVETWKKEQYYVQDAIPDTIYADLMWLRSLTIVDIAAGQMRDFVGGGGLVLIGLLLDVIGSTLNLFSSC